ncbi:MAG: hypothetical protein IT203_05600, partial [Fimbriimonadaceae bacterium]|nr:hypothetical protein [Fimbriimonadaceae bacterium]
MIELKEKPHSLIDNHATIEAILATLGPDSYRVLRQSALARFQAIGI